MELPGPLGSDIPLRALNLIYLLSWGLAPPMLFGEWASLCFSSFDPVSFVKCRVTISNTLSPGYGSLNATLVIRCWSSNMRRLVSSKSVSQAAILLLLSSSCALANDGARRSGRDGLLSGGAEPWKDITAGSGMRMAGILQVGHGDDATVEEKIMLSSHSVDNDLLELRWRSPTQNEVAQITPPPSNPLAIRQDQSQIDQLNSRIQSLQQSAQDALQQLSQSSRQVSQASQQLSQSSQQLSQQSQQLSQSSQQLSQSLQQATQSINALQQSVSSALSSGSSAFASCTNSASSVIAAASNDAANQITAAQAQATLARVCVLESVVPLLSLSLSLCVWQIWSFVEFKSIRLIHIANPLL